MELKKNIPLVLKFILIVVLTGIVLYMLNNFPFLRLEEPPTNGL